MVHGQHTHVYVASKGDMYLCVKIGGKYFPCFDGYLLIPRSITLERFETKRPLYLWEANRLVERTQANKITL